MAALGRLDPEPERLLVRGCDLELVVALGRLDPEPERLLVRGLLDDVAGLEEDRDPPEDRAEDDFERLDDELEAFDSFVCLSLGAADAAAGSISSAVKTAIDPQLIQVLEATCLVIFRIEGPGPNVLTSLSQALSMTCLLHGPHPVSPSPV